jgi:hypothetical protein
MRRATEFRFGVGSPEEPRSAVWRVWASGEEAYLSVRFMTRVAKLSMHSDGNWQFNAATVNRKWRRPREFRPGWTQGPAVSVPHTNVARPLELDQANVHPDVAWFGPPSAGNKLLFTLLFAQPAVSTDDWRQVTRPDDQVAAVVPLRDGSHMYVSLRQAQMTEFERRSVTRYLETMQVRPGDSESVITAAVVLDIGEDEMGHPLLMDISLGSEHIVTS